MAPRSRKLSGVGRGVAAFPVRGAGDVMEGVVAEKSLAERDNKKSLVDSDNKKSSAESDKKIFLAESDNKENEEQEVIVADVSEDVKQPVVVKKVARVNGGKVSRGKASVAGGSGGKTLLMAC